ncbi:MAG: hypothetical protein CLLPBCKN_000131 [Chroococcidiopsis cubana SAG 39.79]|uniref:DDE domain-containing protein n=1 Tax=Chroococcidiopsis cubana SAG 39.79 TaxID=388085 RepID=A0AB37UBB0_9CYAN|nr:hypothetical protein [Chroococcidiopsis cubana]MDZ4870743.1 hypothetical protein [Chroococcidiopsis cubana SAG 39.79]RUT02619.1 hypothetical protein DSM107010_62410 [Chroococcidiopsis cubana SAG 39.79]
MKFLKKLPKKQGFAPRVIATDKLKSYAAAKKEILRGVEHHLPRLQEKKMRRFKSADGAQKFLAASHPFSNE